MIILAPILLSFKFAKLNSLTDFILCYLTSAQGLIYIGKACTIVIGKSATDIVKGCFCHVILGGATTNRIDPTYCCVLQGDKISTTHRKLWQAWYSAFFIGNFVNVKISLLSCKCTRIKMFHLSYIFY